LIEPFLEFGPVTITIDNQVEFDVGGCRQAQAAPGEVGTAKNRVLAPAIIDVIQLAVQQVGLPDRANLYLVAHPGGATAGDFLLLQPIGQFQALVFDLEGLFVGLVRIERGNESWLAK
jgi:hypothetical protein